MMTSSSILFPPCDRVWLPAGIFRLIPGAVIKTKSPAGGIKRD